MNTKKTLLSNAIKLACLGMYAAQGAYAQVTSGSGDVSGIDIDVVSITDDAADVKTLVTIAEKTTVTEIDWNNFNIAEGEEVRFDFGDVDYNFENGSGSYSSTNLVVNNVLNGSSSILGSLSSDGHVVLINPRGVIFSQAATVNVGALTVSGLASSIGDADEGELLKINASGISDATGNAAGLVSNLGQITAHAGDVTLIGNSVRNLKETIEGSEFTGSIFASKGTINMVGANSATISVGTSGLVSVAVESGALRNELEVDESVFNSGVLDGAHVVIETRVADNLFNYAVNNAGTIKASGIDTTGGSVRLVASVDSESDGVGRINNSGSITVSAEGADFGAALGEGLNISAVDGFNNSNVITATKLSMSVGKSDAEEVPRDGDGNPVEPTVSDLGNVTITGNLPVEIENRGGHHGFNLSGVESITDVKIDESEPNVFVANNVNSEGVPAEIARITGADRIEIVGATLNGTDGNDEFSLTENGVRFSGVEFVDFDSVSGGESFDGDGIPNDRDVVILPSSTDLSVSTSNTVTFSEITFSDIEVIDTNGGNLLGGDANEKFSVSGSDVSVDLLDADGQVTDSGSFSYTGLGQVLGNGGANSIAAGAVTLTGVEGQVSAGGLLFSDLTSVASSSVTGANGVDETFEVFTEDNALYETVSKLTFSGVDTVAGGEQASDRDVVMSPSATDLSVVFDETVSFSNIIFSDVEVIDTNGGDLLGGGANEKFSVSGSDVSVDLLDTDGQVTDSSSFSYTGLGQVLGNGGANSIAAGAVTLTGVEGQVSAGGLLFSDLTSVASSSVTGANGVDETFEVQSQNKAVYETVSKLTFSGVDTVAGGEQASDRDVVMSPSATDLSVVFDETVSFSNIIFSDVEVIDTNGGDLLGGGANEKFSVSGSDVSVDLLDTDGQVTDSSSFSYTGLGQVLGNGGANSIAAGAVTLTGVEGQVSAGGLLFSDLTSVASSSVTGANGVDETFEVFTEDNALYETVSKLTFSGVDTVAGGEQASDRDVVMSPSATDLSVVFDETVSFSNIIFSDVEVIDTNGGDLLGGGANEKFSVSGSDVSVDLLDTDGQVTDSSSFSYTGLGQVLGNGGANSIAAGAVTLTGVEGQVSAGGLLFSDLTSVASSSVTGANGVDETFEVQSQNKAVYETVSKLTFSGVDTVAGGEQAGDRDVVMSPSATDLSVVFDETVSFSNIIFSDVEVIDTNGGDLLGGGANEKFSVSGSDVSVDLLDTDGQVTDSSSFSYTGLGQVLGNGGANSIAAGAVTLTGVEGQVSAGGLLFSDLTSVASSSVTGANGVDETFEVQSQNKAVYETVSKLTFSGVDTVAGGEQAGDRDVVMSPSATDLSVVFDETVSFSNIIFSDVEVIDTNGGNLLGGVSNERFSVTGSEVSVDLLDADGEIEKSSVFKYVGMESVLGGASGGDVVRAPDGEELTIPQSSVITFAGIDFDEVEAIEASNAGLTGTAGADVFTVLEGGRVLVDGSAFEFGNLTGIIGNGGTDTLNTSAVSLTGNLNEVTAHGITATGIKNVASANVTGSTGSDAFLVTGTNTLSVLEMLFSDVDRVTAGATSNSATGAAAAAWSLQGSDTVANSGIDFVGFSSLAANGAGLQGTATGSDTFTVSGADNVTVTDYTATFSGLNGIAGNGGTDTLNAGTVSLTGTSNEVTAHGITATGIKNVASDNVTGSTGSDAFLVTGTNTLSVLEMLFSDVDQVTAGAVSNGATGASGAAWSLQGSDTVANSGIDFVGFSSLAANGAGLKGTATGSDTFTVNGADNVTVTDYTAAFSGLNGIAGNGGTDTLNAGTVSLTGTSNEVTAHGITATGIKNVASDNVTGSTGSDAFLVTGTNTLSVLEMLFSDVDQVTAGAVSNGATGASGAAWSLQGSDTVANSGIDFVGFSSLAANGAGLQGTATGSDTFTVSGADNVTVTDYSATFSGLNGIAGSGGTDTLNAGTVSLTGTSNEVRAYGITATAIKNVVSDNVTGSTGSDAFLVTGTNTLSVLEILFSDVDQVTAGATSNSATGAAAAAWSLQGFDTVANSGIDFVGFSSLAANGAGLQGTASGSDTFTVSGADNVTVTDYSATFSGLNGITGNGGTDTLNAGTVSLTGTSNVVTTHGITATGIKNVASANVTGSTGSDAFLVTGTNTLSVLEMLFSDVDQVTAGAISNSATGASGAAWSLQGTDTVANSGIDFVGFSSLAANGAGLKGTATGSDTFTVNGADNVTVTDYSATFKSLNGIAGSGGTDTLNAGSVSLTGNSNEVTAHGITATGIKNVASSNVTGSAGSDAFLVTGANSLSVLDMLFTSVGSVTAGGVGNSAAGASGVNWLLRDTDTARNSEIDFNGFSSLVASNAALTGTANDETFTLSGSASAIAVGYEGMTFTGLTGVNAGESETGRTTSTSGNHLFTTGYTGTLELTGTDKQIGLSDTFTFTNIDTAVIADLDGTSGDDTFTVTDSGAITTADMAISGLSTVVGGEGKDILDADGTAQLLDETVDGETVKYAQNAGIKFYDIDKILAALLEGDDGDNHLAFTAEGVVTLDGVELGGSTDVDAKGGTDTVTGFSGDNWLITGESSAENHGVAFQNVEILKTVNANLLGTAGADNFTLNSDGTVSIGELTVHDMTEVLGNGGLDSLTASAFSDGLSLSSTSGKLSANDLLFSGIQSATVGTLTGTDGDDLFEWADNDVLSVGSFTFNAVTTLHGAGGADTFTSVGSDGWKLAAGAASVTHGGLTLNTIETFGGGSGIVTGNGAGHDFTVTGSNAFSVASLKFTDISQVNAGAGSDDVTTVGLVTLAGASGAFATSGIDFTGIDSATASALNGSAGADIFVMSGSGALSVFDIVFDGLTSVAAAGGDDQVTSRAGVDYQLAADNSVSHDGIQFTGVELFNGSGAALSVSGQETAQIAASGSVASGAATFNGLSSMALQDAAIDLVALDGVTLSGSNAVSSGGIAVTGVSTVSRTNTFTGAAGDDVLTAQGNNTLVAGGIVFSDVNSVAGGAGKDSVIGQASGDWTLQGAAGSLAHAGMQFTQVESASAGSGHVVGSAAATGFRVAGSGVVEADGIAFSDVQSVAAGKGSDTVSTTAGERWILGAQSGSASVADIAFTGIEQVTTNAAIVDGSQNTIAESYTLSADSSVLSVLDILFDNVAEVFSGEEGGNQVASAAESWQLGTEGTVSANGVVFHDMDQVLAENAGLIGSSANEQFVLAGSEGELSAQGIAFTGIRSVVGNGGADQIIGTDGNETFELAASGDIRVAAIDFSGVASVDARDGDDRVSGGNGQWTSATENSALVDGSAVAQLESISVLFENLERVADTGAYSGPNLAADYLLSGPSELTIGGVQFGAVQSIAAGSDADTLYGMDAALSWALGDSASTVGDEQFSVSFTGFENLVAGAGADTFHMDGGTFDSVDTGAGADIVYMSGTLLDSLLLGDGDDLVQLLAGAQPTVLSAGAGSDRLEVFLASQTWEITGDSTAQNKVGNFGFSGFEQLADTTGGLNLVSSQQLDFTTDGSEAGVNFSAAGMALEYDPAGDLTLTSSSRETIGGSLKAQNAVLNLAGDLDIESDLDSLSLSSGGADVDVSIVAQDDLHIDQINAGRGSVSLASAGFGLLTAETFGETHITAGTIQLGSQLQRWGNIGTEINPLRMDASQSVDIVALSYFEPAFVGQQPTFTATGDQLESVAGAQTAQGLKSAIQNPVDDIAQLDPGIFSEVTPYSLGIDALNLPEVQLHGGELQPLGGSDDDEEEQEESAKVEDDSVEGAVLESAMLEPLPMVVGGR